MAWGTAESGYNPEAVGWDQSKEEGMDGLEVGVPACVGFWAAEVVMNQQHSMRLACF